MVKRREKNKREGGSFGGLVVGKNKRKMGKKGEGEDEGK